MIDREIKARIQKYIKLSNIRIFDFDSINPLDMKNKDEIYDLIINRHKINDCLRINKFHEVANSCLIDRGLYVSAVETLEQRRIRVQAKTPIGFKNIFRIIDFLYKRVFPKLPLFKRVYFFITSGRNRVISKAEVLGRLISCGFNILEYFEYNNLLYVISNKVNNPDFNMNPSYGPIFKMNRVGYQGEIIGVYKLRTMYPYSEYCQDLIIKENKLAKSGKIANDYRLTTWGKIFRRFWIDELPMLINFFKLELNLVGVRPLSKSYFAKYPKKLQNLRIKVKPGLIPPYYVDMPSDFDEILDSEEKYLKQKLQSPFLTDFKYFFKAVWNIAFKGARSS